MISWPTSDVAGVNFGDTHITVARLLRKQGGDLEIAQAGMVACDPGGLEKDVAAVLRKLWRDVGIPTTAVVASLRSAAMVLRYFRFPAMPISEVRCALRLQAEECLQIPSEQVVVDWHVNPERPSNGSGLGKTVEGVFAAAPLKDVERSLSVLLAAGLDPIVLDVRAMAIANLHAALGEKSDDETTCLVNLSPHSADIVILSKSGAIYPHTVFCRASTWADAPAFLGQNIRDVMKYSEFKLDWFPVKRVILMGEMPPADGGFLTQVQEGVKLPVGTWDPLKRLIVKAKRVKDFLSSGSIHAPMLMPSLGLALRRD